MLVSVRVRGGPTVLAPRRAFAGQPVVQVIDLPDGKWEMAGQPFEGWTAPLEPERRLWLGSGLVLSLVPMTVVFVFTWRRRVRRQYQARTEALVEERTAALARTSVIVAHSPVILVRWRPGEDSGVEYVSDNIAQFGYSADAFHAGRVRWTDIVLPEERRPIDLNDAVATLLTMLKRVIGELGEHIELEFAPGAAIPSVEADPVQIEQVLVNLCVNARDAMSAGGRVAISTSVVDIGEGFVEKHRWVRTGRFARLSVTDDGPGIPPEIREHIFEPFFTTKEVGKGTGLGLRPSTGSSSSTAG